MRCLECDGDLVVLDNEHLLACSGLTLHEYAMRHHLPLDMLLQPDQIGSVFEAPPFAAANGTPDEAARATLQGLRWAGLVQEVVQEPVAELPQGLGRQPIQQPVQHRARQSRPDRRCDVIIPGEVRRLDLLLWDVERLADYGFRFRQAYDYEGDAHRVVARSYLQAPLGNLRVCTRQGLLAAPEPPPPFVEVLAVFVGHVAELQAGYLMMPFADAVDADAVRERLARDHGIHCVLLDYSEQPGGGLLRTRTPEDTTALFALLQSELRAMPGVWERFHEPMPTATVTKELIFDAAHFITDHPAKCSNLHGGRYLLQVQMTGRVDPVTGCVVDYGYLKRVVGQHIIERFDHHTLNYAAPELAWRSSTEMVCVYVWEQLIDFLPGLSGLRLYETTQSWCDYRGPTLAEHQALGSHPLLHPLDEIAVVDRRRLLGATSTRHLRVVDPCA